MLCEYGVYSSLQWQFESSAFVSQVFFFIPLLLCCSFPREFSFRFLHFNFASVSNLIIDQYDEEGGGGVMQSKE
jgi:hypothetical protein